ncbi:hypothetical protein [Kribbella sp. DT2]|uniref:hypothetical protein n=1 Tax=Kribbella sp. DT2 TaxID=3393427 RepID=UPI003CE9D8A0
MRAYLLTAPRWILCLLYGLPFGAIMTVGILWDNASGALEVILFGLVVGLLYGVGVTIVNEKPRREVRALIGEVPREQISAVFRGARSGRVPADREVRAAALRPADHDSSRALRGAIIGIPFAVLIIAAAISGRNAPRFPLFAASAVLLVVVTAHQCYRWRSLKRRIELLTPTKDSVQAHRRSGL